MSKNIINKNKKISAETMYHLKRLFANPYKTYSMKEEEAIEKHLKRMKSNSK